MRLVYVAAIACLLGGCGPQVGDQMVVVLPSNGYTNQETSQQVEETERAGIVSTAERLIDLEKQGLVSIPEDATVKVIAVLPNGALKVGLVDRDGGVRTLWMTSNTVWSTLRKR